MLILLESASYISYKLYENKFFFIKKSILQTSHVVKLKKIFDKDLGWKQNPKRSDPDVQYDWLCFGDSFTYGDEVELPQSWPFYLQELSGKKVMNGGVSGYGLGQSYLRYKRETSQAEGRLVLMAFISNNLRRMLSRSRLFKGDNSFIVLPKPRFALDQVGDLKLLPNPIGSINEVDKLNDIEFLKGLAAEDHWMKVNPPPVAQFPYSHLLFSKRFWTAIWKVSFLGRSSKYADDYETDSSTQIIFKRVLSLWKRTLQSRKQKGVLIHLPKKEEFEAFREFKRIPSVVKLSEKNCSELNLICLFPLYQHDLLEGEGLNDLFMPNGHYSPILNRRIAKFLYGKIKELKIAD